MIKCTGNQFDLIDELKDAEKDFIVKQTTRSALVEFEGYKYMYSDTHFSNRYLHFFKKIKDEVRANIDAKKLTPPEIEKSKYFEVGSFDPIGEGEFLSFENCVEFDINKAYYHALLILGYIGPEFYKQCIELPKSVRLALVGSLATQKTVFNYQQGQLIDFDVIEDVELRKVFFHLVTYTDIALDLFSKLSRENFLFYWVDGIYLKNYDRAEYHKNLIEYEYKLKFKTEAIKKVIVYNKGDYSTQICVKKSDEDFKTFTLNNIFVRNDKN